MGNTTWHPPAGEKVGAEPAERPRSGGRPQQRRKPAGLGDLIGLQMQERVGTSAEQEASGLEVPGQLLPQRVPLALQRRSGISMGEI